MGTTLAINTLKEEEEEEQEQQQQATMKSIAILHRKRIEQLLNGNAYKDKNHPIYNFLFQYFHFNTRRLLSYSPGLGHDLSHELDGHCQDVPELMQYTCKQPDGLVLLSPASTRLDPKKQQAMITTLTLLRNCYAKPPNYGCFGLHEWAMVFRYDDISNSNTNNRMHQSLPLRLSRDEINAIVERQPLRCTHYDATRFFTSQALPLNRISPTPSRTNQPDLDQPGCIHATMDLFKWSIKVYPYLSSHVIADALELAILAREIDMRASPYDLTAYQPVNALTNGNGFSFNSEPIRIETMEGRKEYVRHQDNLYTQSQPIRLKLIKCYEDIIACNHRTCQ